jgi:hypothetical protein
MPTLTSFTPLFLVRDIGNFKPTVAAWFQAIAAGEFSKVTKDLERLLGRPPQTARDFYRVSHHA